MRELVETINGNGKVYFNGRVFSNDDSCGLGYSNMENIVNVMPSLNYYEANIESIIFYKSLCFIIKR